MAPTSTQARPAARLEGILPDIEIAILEPLIEEIAPLESVVLGQTGARRNSSLALAADGTPHVAFADTSGVWYAVRSNGVWDVQQVAEAADRPFGQLVSLALDAADAPHLAFTELIATGPLNGLIVYASRAPAWGQPRDDLPVFAEMPPASDIPNVEA